MRGEQLVQPGKFVDDVFVRAPVESDAAVDIDFLPGQPLYPAGECITAVHAGECTEPVSEQRPGAPSLGQAIVVMGFAVIN